MRKATAEDEIRLRGSMVWQSVALFALTAVAVVTCVLFSNALLFSLAGAVTLAVVTDPFAAWLKRRVSPGIAATILVVLVTMAVLLPVVLMLNDLLEELIAFIRFVGSGGAAAALQEAAQKHEKIGGLIQRGLRQFDVVAAGKQAASMVAGHLGSALGQVATGVTDAVLLLFFYFFLVRDSEAAVQALRGLLPLGDADADDLLRQTGDVVTATFAGRLVIAVIQGALAGAAYLVLGVPGALLWTAVTAVCCLVPAFGAFIAWIPIALYLGLAQSWTKAGILAVWGGLIVGNIDNVLYPVLVGKKTDLHTAVIFVAIFGGLAVFGISGFVLGPAIVVVAMFLIGVWKRYLAAVA